ncbi:hypothetical protein DRV85_04155 [Rhodosalinus halophilus]|uniref:Uncharacterized protein n=1 Tax=Rhodosalinus halophilus TaxID=2259333 RepID=A0A365UBM3_9RHOB|nr:EthD family reductase [Rhodosalinus halophilus]RBI86631.1 hypothetical protein DRV85_04155 [Rhodosalinus halophilus]
MFVVSVLYPPGEFDLGYYRDTHLPMVRRLLEPAGMSEMGYWRPSEMDPASPYQLIAELRFPDRATGLAALDAHGAETQADIPNFTPVTPVIVMGEMAAD